MKSARSHPAGRHGALWLRRVRAVFSADGSSLLAASLLLAARPLAGAVALLMGSGGEVLKACWLRLGLNPRFFPSQRRSTLSGGACVVKGERIWFDSGVGSSARLAACPTEP